MIESKTEEWEIAEKIISKIMSEDKIPEVMKKNDIVRDVVEDVIVEMMLNYDKGKSSLKTYLSKYAKKRSVERLWSAYRKQLKTVSFEESESMDEESNFKLNREMSKAAIQRWIDQRRKSEDKDLGDWIRKTISREEDHEILNMMSDGKTIREIAFELYGDESKRSRVMRRIDSIRSKIGGGL